jgi:hypothetical protein
MDNAPFATGTIALQRHHEKRFIQLMIYLASRNELDQPELPYCILTQKRMMIYVQYLLSWRCDDNVPRILYYDSFRGSVTNFFRRQWYLGGNPERIVLNSSMPRHFNRPIHHFIKVHFDSIEMQQIIRKNCPRELICASDLDNALEANHPHSRNFSADFLMMFMSLQAGLRSGTISFLRLQDIINIDINSNTLRIRICCNMLRFKARGEGMARVKTFSGFIDMPNNPVYHLHQRILEMTGGEMGLIRCHSSQESMYGYKNDPASVGIVANDILNNNFTTIIDYIYEQEDEDLRNKFLFNRGTTAANPKSSRAKMVKRRFSHYPNWLIDRFVFHCLRAGFYVTTVYNVAKNNAWNTGQALDFAKLLGEWRIKTDPSIWYGGDLLQRFVDHSLLSEGNPNFIVNVLETPQRAHNLRKAPSLEDNPVFKMKQQTLTVKVAKEMITMAVTARRLQLTLNENYTDRQLLSMTHSLDLAVASFYNRVVDDVDHITAVVEGWSYIEEEIWPGLAKTREELKIYIHENICLQVLEGLVNLVKD